MIRRAYAKVNLALNIKQRLNDGYHDLEMINVKTSLYDLIFMNIVKNGNNIYISSNKLIPYDKNNLVYKVIVAFKNKFNLEFTCDVFIRKNIPMQAGLAGGSADAACVLKMLYKYFKIKENLNEMINLLLPITADGPFMLYDRLCKVTGKGETVKPINARLDGKMLLVKPNSGMNTKDVFNAYDDNKYNQVIDIKKVENALVKHEYNALTKSVGNSLLDTIMLINKDVTGIINKLKAFNFDVASVTGSGSTCFAISKNRKLYRNAKKVFDKENFELVKVVRFR